MLEPRLARACARLVIPTSVRQDSLEALAEGFRRRVSRAGAPTARRWYWWQVLRAVPVRLTETAEAAGAVLTALASGGWGRDLSAGLRTIRRRPGYALSVMATVGIGLGAATAILAVADGVWFRPLPLPDPGKVVRVYELERNVPDDGVAASARDADALGRPSHLSPPLLDDLQHHVWRSFTAFAAFVPRSLDWAMGDNVQRLSGLGVSLEGFAVLGVRPALGHVFRDSRAQEVMLTAAFWRSAFGSDPTVLGRTIELSDVTFTVVGVLPDDLPYPGQADVWLPLALEPEELAASMRGARYLDVAARVRPAVSVAEAEQELDLFIGGLGDDYAIHRGWGASLVALKDALARPYTRALTILLAAGLAFLLITAANVAGLGAARVAQSRHDRAVRLALGASRARLLRQSLVETAVLTAGGAALAAFLALWVLGPIKRLAPADVPRLAEAGMDGRILAMLALVAVVMALATGLASHLLGRIGVPTDIARDIGAFRERHRGRRVLLVSQIAVATVLLVGGAVVGRYFRALTRTDLGFRAEGLTLSPVALSGDRYVEDGVRATFFRQLIDHLGDQGLRGALAVNPPITGSTMRFGYWPGPEEEQAFAQYHTVTPGYFSLLGIPLLSGRDFEATDDLAHGEVVIVNDVVARQFADGRAVGRIIGVSGRHGRRSRTIVGVVGSVRHFGPDQEAPAELYVPVGQDAWNFGHVYVAGADGEAPPPAALRDALGRLDPRVPATALEPVATYLTTWFAPLRFQVVILALLSGVGILLGGIGLYGFIAYVVSARTREIGIRMALGATQAGVALGTLREGVGLSLLGAGLGSVAALALQRIFRSLVPGVDPTDPLAFLPVVLAVAAVSALACSLPARRAAIVDPSEALRHD